MQIILSKLTQIYDFSCTFEKKVGKNLLYLRHALICTQTRNPPKVRSHLCVNYKPCNRKFEINFIFFIKALHIPNFCCTFAGGKVLDMSNILLDIRDLHASIGGKEILKGVDLTVCEGEVHAIMGPNGAGKSTLSAVLTGHPAYTVTHGEVFLRGEDLLAMEPEVRARAGVFLSFQYPVEIPGVSMTNFMRTALNEKRAYEGKEALSAKEFITLMREKRRLLELPDKLNNRSVNEGFSGGEKKKNEIFQMAMLEPALAILDETDSGLDIDALRIVAEGVNRLKKPDNATIVITHYQRLLDYIVPDFVHVLADGKIIKTGDKSLALELEEKGYEGIDN